MKLKILIYQHIPNVGAENMRNFDYKKEKINTNSEIFNKIIKKIEGFKQANVTNNDNTKNNMTIYLCIVGAFLILILFLILIAIIILGNELIQFIPILTELIPALAPALTELMGLMP